MRTTLFCALLLALGSSHAAEPAKNAAEPINPASSTEQSAPEAAMRVYVDPETGAFSATPVTDEQRAQAQAEAAVARSQSSQYPSRRMPDGSLMVEFGESMMISSTASLDAEGNTQLNCDRDHSQEAHDAHAPATSTEGEPK
jgi:hypothetical protein